MKQYEPWVLFAAAILYRAKLDNDEAWLNNSALARTCMDLIAMYNDDVSKNKMQIVGKHGKNKNADIDWNAR